MLLTSKRRFGENEVLRVGEWDGSDIIVMGFGSNILTMYNYIQCDNHMLYLVVRSTYVC